MKKLVLFALVLTIVVVSAIATGYAASPQPSAVTEVESELHPPNEVMRELHPDRYKSHYTGGVSDNRTPDYGRTPTY